MSRKCIVPQILAFLGCVAETDRGWSEEPPLTGRVENVTLYRGQAMVTRSVPVKGAAGLVEVVVGSLPSKVVPASLFAEGSKNLEVRSVQYRTKAVGEAPQEDIRKLDEQIAELERKTKHNSRLQQFVSERLNYLSKLESFSADRAKADLANGALVAEALEKLTNFIFEKGKGLADESLRLSDEAKTLENELNLLRHRRNELAQDRSLTLREAILFLNKKDADDAQLKLGYLEDGAGWSPSYNFRGSTEEKELAVEFNAVVEQSTGEDWDEVALAFSTASPVLHAKGPDLTPFQVTLAPGAPDEAKPSHRALSPGSLQRQVQSMGSHRLQAESLLQIPGQEYEQKMNAAANDFQSLELIIDQKAIPQIQSAQPMTDQLPSVTYPLKNSTTLASRSSVQIVPIASMKLPCAFQLVATPVLTSQVYREAEVENTFEKPLLGGDVHVYFEQRFVGREEIATVASGERFHVGFGSDAGLRGRRELAEKSEQAQGGNRETQFQYRLVLENFGEAPAQVRLLDRIPVVADSASDILLTLETPGRPLSEDAEYLRRDRAKGILRWDVEIPARAHGKNALVIEYEYKMQFDRNLHLASLNESLSARAWRHESWSNQGHIRSAEDSGASTMLELVCMPGGNGKAAFANEVRRNLSKKRAITFDVHSPEKADIRVAVGIVTGPGYTWYESKPMTAPSEQWAGVRFDLTQKDWKSIESNWEYTALPDGLADVRKVVLLVYNEGVQCKLQVDAIRFENLE